MTLVQHDCPRPRVIGKRLSPEPAQPMAASPIHRAATAPRATPTDAVSGHPQFLEFPVSVQIGGFSGGMALNLDGCPLAATSKAQE